MPTITEYSGKFIVLSYNGVGGDELFPFTPHTTLRPRVTRAVFSFLSRLSISSSLGEGTLSEHIQIHNPPLVIESCIIE